MEAEDEGPVWEFTDWNWQKSVFCDYDLGSWGLFETKCSQAGLMHCFMPMQNMMYL